MPGNFLSPCRSICSVTGVSTVFDTALAESNFAPLFATVAVTATVITLQVKKAIRD